MTTTVIDVLTEARNLVEAGWTQGRFREVDDTEVRHCAAGAVYAVEGPGHGAADRALRAALPPRYDRSTVAFNDEPGRTKAEVVALFDLAIEMQDPDFLV